MKMNKKTAKSAGYIALFGIVFLLYSCQSGKQKTPDELVIFHAGSLSMPFKMMKDSFEFRHPEIKILTESAGSVASARKITELGKTCDILAVADYAVIDDMLIPTYADWNFKFATNEMALVFTKKSKHAGEINSGNWLEILQKPDVVYGRSDPDADPCGYRTVLCLKLAEKIYHQPGLAKEILSRHTRHIRPKEVDLLALLEGGNVDYLFVYRSVAIQHNLNFITLPDSVNLRNPALADWYAGVETEIKGDAPGKFRTIKGEPMVYSFCIPKNAPHPDAAEKFVRYLVDNQGGGLVMEVCGQPTAIPASTKSFDKLPEYLKKLARP